MEKDVTLDIKIGVVPSAMWRVKIFEFCIRMGLWALGVPFSRLNATCHPVIFTDEVES